MRTTTALTDKDFVHTMLLDCVTTVMTAQMVLIPHRQIVDHSVCGMQRTIATMAHVASLRGVFTLTRVNLLGRESTR